ncbi:MULTISPECIES: vWA domain-containing protein [unclassified Paenarthrobacter]|uniref:vWA domain-containing protein n=1 Tax=unclassified Paenarthrobacter TaxID=2634190 RepID=UPI003CE93805
MELTYWWLLPLAAAAVAAAWLVLRRAPRPYRPVAHSDRMTHLPEYKKALARYRFTLVLGALLGAVFLAASVTAAARPVQRSTHQPEVRNRDIVLCLDVSGSMAGTDAAIAGVFKELAKEFDGERIGMVIFDSSSVQLFPLTDDYDYVAGQLSEAQEAFESGAGSFFDGTWQRGGSSLIGDGLASCVQSFPEDHTEGGGTRRTRSVVLATDNFLSGNPVFTLEEAAALARSRDVAVHALNPGDLDYGDDPVQPGAQLRAAVEGTGGSYHALDSPGAVPGIVQQVQDSEASAYLAAPQAVVSDDPAWPLGIAVVSGMGLLVVGWRLQA